MGFKNEVRKCVDAIGRLPGVVDIDVPQLLDDEWGVVLSLSTCDHGWATLGALACSGHCADEACALEVIGVNKEHGATILLRVFDTTAFTYEVNNHAAMLAGV